MFYLFMHTGFLMDVEMNTIFFYLKFFSTRVKVFKRQIKSSTSQVFLDKRVLFFIFSSHKLLLISHFEMKKYEI